MTLPVTTHSVPDWIRRAAKLLNDLSAKVDKLMTGGGSKDELNSTDTPLGAGVTFTGEWVTANDPHIGFNLTTDQDGEFFVDISLDGGTTTSFSKKYDIRANESRFDAFVKLRSRSHRVRFINGPVAQTKLVINTETGDSLFPFAVSERDEPGFVAYQGAGISADTYAILVDLSDTVNWPHNDKGRIDLYSSFFFVDKAANTVGLLQLGTIVRIDGTDADISYSQGISFNSSSERIFQRDRVLSAPLKLGQSGGVLTKVATLFTETNVGAVNTGTPLGSARGNVTPALGDLILKFSHISGGSYDGTVSIQYAGHVSTT